MIPPKPIMNLNTEWYGWNMIWWVLIWGITIYACMYYLKLSWNSFSWLAALFGKWTATSSGLCIQSTGVRLKNNEKRKNHLSLSALKPHLLSWQNQPGSNIIEISPQAGKVSYILYYYIYYTVLYDLQHSTLCVLSLLTSECLLIYSPTAQ